MPETETPSSSFTMTADERTSKEPEQEEASAPSQSGGPAARGLDTSGSPVSKVVKASGPRIPPKPQALEGDMVTAFAETRTALDAIVGEQNQRVIELKVAATQNIEQAVARLEESARHTRALMERNEVLAREADRLTAEGAQLETQQEELETKVQKSAERNALLAERANALREERQRLQEEREEFEDVVLQETEDLATARADVERLKERRDKLQEENAEIERVRTRLEENIGRLERIRDEYVSAVNRLKGTKDDLLKIPGEDDA